MHPSRTRGGLHNGSASPRSGGHDGATREDLEAVITCAMAAWDSLTSTTDTKSLRG